MTDVNQFLNSPGEASAAIKLLEEFQPGKKVAEGAGIATGGRQLQVVVGNRKWVGLNGFEVSSEVEHIITRNESSGQTVILVGIDSKNTAVLQYHHTMSEIICI